MNISDVLKEIRFTKGWTQKELGEHLGMHGNLISEYEIGKRKPYMPNIYKILKFAKEECNMNFSYKDLQA